MTTHRKALFGLAACAALALPAWAQEVPVADAAPASAEVGVPAPQPATPLPMPERHWRLGIALGKGERSNPLIESDDIPVYVDLDIAWFGKRWFFDNGDIGFELLDNRVVTANLVARVNSDRVYFSKSNTKYVTLAYGPNGSTPPAVTPSGQLVVDPVPVVVPERSYAIEAGLEFLFGGDWGQGSFTAFQDVSKAHEGYELAAEYSYRWVRGRFSLSPSVGLRYKSDKRNDYYWGVHADETSPVLLGYEAEAGVNYQAGLRASAYLTRHLRLALSANYERLDSSIADSPLVARPYVFGYFAGLAFQF